MYVPVPDSPVAKHNDWRTRQASGGCRGPLEGQPLVEAAAAVNGGKPRNFTPPASVNARRWQAPASVLWHLAMRRSIPLLLTLAVLGGCASTDDYPSLARRPIERVSGTAEPVAPVVEAAPAPVAPEVAGKLAALVAKARTADAKFTAREGEARRRVAAARGAAVGSEAWSVAMVALAALESARSDAMIALADLDTIYASDAVVGGNSAASGAAREQVVALVARQDSVLAALRGGIRA